MDRDFNGSMAMSFRILALVAVLGAWSPLFAQEEGDAGPPCPIRERFAELGARVEAHLTALGRRAHETLTRLGERAEITARRLEDRLESLPGLDIRRRERSPKVESPVREERAPLVVAPRRDPQAPSPKPQASSPAPQAPTLSGPAAVEASADAPDWVSADSLGAFQARGLAPTAELAEQRAREALGDALQEKLAALVKQDAALRDYSPADRDVALQESADVLAAGAKVRRRYRDARGDHAVLLEIEPRGDAALRAEFARRLGTAQPRRALPIPAAQPLGDDF